ncbi:2562_t:CDS:1, partial [Acaulospora colombiana]
MAEIEAAKAPHTPNDVDYTDMDPEAKGARHLSASHSHSDEQFDEKKGHLHHEQDDHDVYNPNV